MSRNSKAEQRQRLRKEGLRPVEIWLPSSIIEKLDAMKAVENTSRDAVIMALMQDTPDVPRPTRAGEQLALI